MRHPSNGDRHYPGFRVRLRGFDRAEVVAVLAKLAGENEEARRENERLGVEIERLQAAVAEQLGSERHMQRALIAASKIADQIREDAEEQARQLLRDAEERGEAIVQRLREQARGLEGQIDALLARRRDVEASMETFIKVLAEELQHARQQSDEPEDGPLARTG